MIFQTGNEAGRRWPQGVSGNPAGRRAGLPTLQKRAVAEIMRAVDDILTDPANIQKWRDYVQRRWDEDPGSFVREIVMPLSPRESLTLFRSTDSGLAALTISQLKAIAATLPQNAGEETGEGEDKGGAIDVLPEATDGARAALPAPEETDGDFDPEAGF